MIRLDQGDCGGYLVVDVETGEDILVQVDFDFPSLASTFGWDFRSVQTDEWVVEDKDKLGYDGDPYQRGKVVFEGSMEDCRTFAAEENIRNYGIYPAEKCHHTNTDGTVDCKDCGLKAIDFITAAQEYLDNHIGDEVEDPGYFIE